MHSDDPRFTAYALGEPLTAAEQSALDAALAADPALRAELADLESLAAGLRQATRASDSAPAPAPVAVPASRPRLLPFRESAEDVRWRRQLVRIAAVFLVSAGAIGGAAWWTSQRETRAKLPEESVAVIELDLDSAPVSGPASDPSTAPAAVRAGLRERWDRLAAALLAGTLPAARSIPDASGILGLLPGEPGDATDRVSVATAAQPGGSNRSWLRVSVPVGLAVGGSVRVHTRRMDDVTVREVAGGIGPQGERVVLFEVASTAVAPLLQVQVGGIPPVEIEAAALRGDFRTAPPGLRGAAVLASLSAALRVEKSQASGALRAAAALAESAGEPGKPVASLARRAAELADPG